MSGKALMSGVMIKHYDARLFYSNYHHSKARDFDETTYLLQTLTNQHNQGCENGSQPKSFLQHYCYEVAVVLQYNTMSIIIIIYGHIDNRLTPT